jgi:phosphoribosylformimino-5-aminoimidazole carboxamide ribotide isomerase
VTVIPAIDLRAGRCVRLFQGDFGRETLYSVDPGSVALGYRQAGFRQLHVVDLDGARDGEQQHEELVTRIVHGAGLAVQLGGGIRSRQTLARWLAAGVSRCVIGSVAVSDPVTAIGWLEDFGADRIVMALDLRMDRQGIPTLSVDGWTKAARVSLWECLDRYSARGAKHVLCTDIGRDGALSGPNLPLYAEIRRRYPDLALQASGGVRHAGDLRDLRDAGCAAAITGRALLDGRINREELTSFLQDA